MCNVALDDHIHYTKVNRLKCKGKYSRICGLAVRVEGLDPRQSVRPGTLFKGPKHRHLRIGQRPIDLLRYIVFPHRSFGLERTFATRHAHRAPRHALGPSAFCTGYTLSYPQAVRKTPPSPPRDERAIARSLDVWHDLRGGTHGFGPRLGRGARVLRFLFRGAV